MNGTHQENPGPAARRVVIVGAGIIGCALAYRLATRGAQVTVIERDRPAAGATGVSFAWLNSQAIFRNVAGDENLQRQYFALHRLALGAWRGIEHELGPVGIRWNGMVTWCAPGSDEQERFEAELARRQHWGSPTRRVDADTIAALVPGCQTGQVGTGFYGPDEGNVDPRAAVAAVAGAALRLGADFRWPCEATELNKSDGTVTGVQTDKGVIECDEVVITAGAASPTLAAQVGITVPLEDSQGAIVHLEPLPLFLQPVFEAPQIHALQRPDGRVLVARHFAGTPVVEGTDINADALVAETAKMLPQVRDAQIERVTTGRRILPTDGLPIIGHNPAYPNVRCMATNAGITLAPLLAQLLTTEILDENQTDLLTPFRSSRFGTSQPF